MIDAGALQAHVVERLQQTAGNQAISGIIQREGPDAGTPAPAPGRSAGGNAPATEQTPQRSRVVALLLLSRRAAPR